MESASNHGKGELCHNEYLST